MSAARTYKELYESANREVSRLADVVRMQAEHKRAAEQERDEWKRRFDRLLECCRSVS